jgi:hypothetical protein
MIECASRLFPKMARAGLLALLLSAPDAGAFAQQPFVTDNAGVTPKGAWHVEYFNEFAALSKSASPDLRQDWSNFVVQYGLLPGLEVNVDFPILLIQRGAQSTLSSAFGLGDVDFAAKYNLITEDPAGIRPALAITGAVEFPTGNKSTQLGSGYTDYGFNSIIQKTLSEVTIVHLNLGVQLSGNTLTGAIGIRTPGRIYTSGISVVCGVSRTLSLGLDLNGAQIRTAKTFDRQLQATAGGSYQFRPNASFDFALLAGWYGSPRVGVLVGTSFSP